MIFFKIVVIIFCRSGFVSSILFDIWGGLLQHDELIPRARVPSPRKGIVPIDQRQSNWWIYFRKYSTLQEGRESFKG